MQERAVSVDVSPAHVYYQLAMFVGLAVIVLLVILLAIVALYLYYEWLEKPDEKRERNM